MLKKYGRYERGLYLQEGITRILFHIERIRFFITRNEKSDVLAYTFGQFTRCALDLLEPQPDSDAFSPLQVAATRMYFLADFKDKNPKFDLLPQGRLNITNFPEHIDTLLKQNTADGNKIYRVYHSNRNYRGVGKEAASSFNRSLYFLVNALMTLESMSRQDTENVLNIRNWLGIDALRGYNDKDNKLKVDKPGAPAKPKAPTKPKVDK